MPLSFLLHGLHQEREEASIIPFSSNLTHTCKSDNNRAEEETTLVQYRSEVNCHPVCSDAKGEFCLVHNGIVTNSAALRLVLQKRGYKLETKTDTEAVAILIKYI